MIDPSLDISEYESFIEYLRTIRTPQRPFDTFVRMVVYLPRSLAFAHLLRATHDPNPAVVCEALDLFVRLSPDKRFDRCIELLSHDQVEVRLVAVDLLHRFAANCEDHLLALLANETNPDVRYACVKYLKDFGTEKAENQLRQIVDQDPSSNYEGRPIKSVAEDALHRITSRSNNAN